MLYRNILSFYTAFILDIGRISGIIVALTVDQDSIWPTMAGHQQTIRQATVHLAHVLDIFGNKGLIRKQISGKFPVSLLWHFYHLGHMEWLFLDVGGVCHQILHTDWLSDKLRFCDIPVLKCPPSQGQ